MAWIKCQDVRSRVAVFQGSSCLNDLAYLIRKEVVLIPTSPEARTPSRQKTLSLLPYLPRWALEPYPQTDVFVNTYRRQ
jgi:hypothetical protein